MLSIKEVAQRFQGAKQTGRTQYMAKCPCHDDRKASLAIGQGENGGVLLDCHAGCRTEDILKAVDLTFADITPDKKPGKKTIVACYKYPSGCEKVRYEPKSFAWRRPDGNGGFIWDRKGMPHELFVAGDPQDTVFIVEGEKDAENLSKLGFFCTSPENGAGSNANSKKWYPSYNEILQNKHVRIIPDNDNIGGDYAATIAKEVQACAASVKILDLKKVWPEIPNKGDVSDMIEALGREDAARRIRKLEDITECLQPLPLTFTASNATKRSENIPTSELPNKNLEALARSVKSLDGIEESEVEWLINGWLPSGQICTLAADGGVGKTTIWCELAAAISAGKSCFLDEPGMERSPGKVLFMSSEDSVSKKLKKQLRLAGANMANIVTVDPKEFDGYEAFAFNSTNLAEIIKIIKPSLCIFDPIQGFVPSELNMGSRNAMRHCLSALIDLGDVTGCTFLLISHTNKRKNAYGRDRVSESSDLWDISRSVLMAGKTEEPEIRYLSHEKSNYARLQKSVLFRIDECGRIEITGTTWKKDGDFIREQYAASSAPKLDSCKEAILTALQATINGVLSSTELEKKLLAKGHTRDTLNRAKKALKDSGEIEYINTGKNGNKHWCVCLVSR